MKSLPEQTLPTDLPQRLPPSLSSDVVQQARLEYGDHFVTHFLRDHSMQRRTEIVTSLSQAVQMPSKALSAYSRQYCQQAVAWWIKQNLIEVFTFCGVFKTISAYQVRRTADLILTQYYYLTPYELMEFFNRFEAGRYRTFYSTSQPNPQALLASLDDFARACLAHRSESSTPTPSSSTDADQPITYEEYRRRHPGAPLSLDLNLPKP